MFVRKNLVQQWDVVKRNSVLKALALFFLGASAVLLFSSADLILNPNVSSSFVYLQKMFLSPSGTLNTQATISFDGTSGSVVANSLSWTNISAINMNTAVFTASVASISNWVNTTQICSSTWANCFNPASVVSLSGDVGSLSGRLAQLESLVQELSGVVHNP